MFRQTDTIEAAEIGVQTESQTLNTAGTTSVPLPIQSVPPQPRPMPFGLMLISQAIWDEAIKIFEMFKAKV